MKRLLLLLLVCAVPKVSWSSTVDEIASLYMCEGDKQRDDYIRMLERAIKRNEKSRQDAHMREYTQKHRDAIEQLRSMPFYPPILLGPSVGSLGHVRFPLVILQRIDDRSALAEIVIESREWYLPALMVAGQAAEKQKTKHKVIIKGLNLANVVDDQKLDISDRLAIISGTQTYTTVLGGTNTVYVVDVVDDSVFEGVIREVMARRKAEKEPEQEQHIEAPKYRTWMDATGVFTVEAAFRGVIAGKVRLERADGRVIMVPLEKLSKEDQKWIAEKGK